MQCIWDKLIQLTVFSARILKHNKQLRKAHDYSKKAKNILFYLKKDNKNHDQKLTRTNYKN